MNRSHDRLAGQAGLIQALLLLTAWGPGLAGELELSGVTVTPHLQMESMRYSRPPEPPEGARVQLFLQRPARFSAPLVVRSNSAVRFGGRTPSELLDSKAWAWHDTPSAWDRPETALPPGSLTVWTFNSRKLPFGVGGRFEVSLGPADKAWVSTNLVLTAPESWISAVTFLGPEDSIRPTSLVLHVQNAGAAPLSIRSCRLWLPADPKTPQVVFAQASLEGLKFFGGKSEIPAHDKGGFTVATAPLPLTYCAVEVGVARAGRPPETLWTHLRIKTERFDISGGWVNGRGNTITNELFLKTLKRLHVNTGHLQETRGYTDTPLYAQYPLKYFNNLRPFAVYDTDAVLPRIHAAEFLGEPQYGGGRPVPPQEVWTKLQPYATTRIPTSLTHSEERIWKDYAGLSDYPHYDAYRVTAPSPDAWAKYDRWEGAKIRWGSPLETIGDMTRSLRELNRPMPIAYWSQGPHEGWDVYGGRKRTSPTAGELRSQAYHALAHRITSLYWFNLSLKSLLKYPDLIEPMERVGREMRMLEPFYLEGDATHFERTTRDGKPDWDFAVVAGPRGAVCFALDLAYTPDAAERVFKFGPARGVKMRFALPSYLRKAAEVVRVDADGVAAVPFTATENGISLADPCTLVAVFVVSPTPGVARELEARRQALVQLEQATGFDPGRKPEDLKRLRGDAR